MTDVLSQPAAHALARALGHFVWQGAAIGLLVLIALRLFRASASARYLIGVCGLVAMVAAPVITYTILANESQPGNIAANSVAISTPLASGAVSTARPVPASTASSSQIDWQAAVLLAWMIGAAAFTLRLTGGWIVARRFATRAVQPASEHIADMVRQLADRMEVGRAIAVVESAAVSVPVMIGWLKPTVVLPIAALAGLSPSQIEALIAHELAHVKRHDYLVNLLQSTVEALLFYHPAVWWLSRRVRAERELCCDDLAVRVCDRLVYATALTDLASFSSPRIALAATDGDLLTRVRRILGRGQVSPAAGPGVAPLLTLAFVGAIVVPATLASTRPTAQHPSTIISPFGEEGAGAPQTRPSPSPSQSPSPKPTTSPEPAATDRLVLPSADQEALMKQFEQIQALYEKQIAEQWNGAELDKVFQQTVEQSKAAREAEIKALLQQLERMKALQEKGLASQQQVADIQALMEKLAAQGNEKAAREAELKAMQQQVERVKALQEKGLVSESKLAEMKALLDKAAGQGNYQAAREAEIKAMQQQLERTQELFQKGLVAQSQLEEVKAAMNKVQAQGDDIAAHAAALREAQIQLERGRSLAEKGLISAGSLEQMELAFKTAQAQLESAQRQHERAEQMTAEAKTAADRLQTDARQRELRAQGELTPKTRLTEVDAATPAQVRDTLNVKIAGEPGLPGVYIIGEDGTIRLPFVGSIKVAGLTAGQAREAIGKRLAEKKLGSVDQVTVSILRGIK